MKQRVQSVDAFRGIAILLVVLGHTLSGTTKDYADTFLFNVIWTLQMPLFMIISGYVTRYGEPPSDMKSFLNFFKKRTIAYLLPWVVWTVLVRGLIFQNALFLDMGYIVWHMDSGYWFLTSLWTICIIYGVGCLIASSLNRDGGLLYSIASTMLLTICCSGILALIGLEYGFAFFGIKLSLYYTPFFLLGYCFGQIQKSFGEGNRFHGLIDITTPILAAVYLAILVRYNIAGDLEDVRSIALRVVASVSGCASVFGFGWRAMASEKYAKALKGLIWFGQNSLGVYLIHGLFLCMIKLSVKAPLSDFKQCAFVICNYTVTLLLSSFFVWVLNCHPIARRLLFGKKN